MQKHESIMTDDWDHCFICGAYPDHAHHCLHGSYKKLADRYKMLVPLCHICHSNLHDHGFKDKYLQQLAQVEFEKHFPDENFLRLFGRNFKYE